jgi:hypothetical protein
VHQQVKLKKTAKTTRKRTRNRKRRRYMFLAG